MKKLLVAGGLLLALWGSGVQAAEFPVSGTAASGKPGDRAFVDLTYDYGTGFGVIAEDLQFEYQFAGMTFNPDASTIDVFGTPQNLLDYATTLRTFAQAHSGSVLVNLDPITSRADYKGYALSFYTADGTPQLRSGLVHLRVAFDILPGAVPGRYEVSFGSANLLADEAGNEFSYPSALQQLGATATVTAVPEPEIAWMLLPGLALVSLSARRRSSRRL